MVKEPWTPAQERVLFAAFDRGDKLPAIATALGRSKRSCQCRLVRSGRRFYTRVSAAEAATMVAMLRRGRTACSVAREVGREPHAVLRAGERAGVPVPPASVYNRKGWEAKRKKGLKPSPQSRTVLEIVSHGPMTLREVTARYGGCHESVGQALRRLRRKGLAVCEGTLGRWGTNRWLAVGWWLAANAGMVYKKAHELRRRFPSVDVEDIASQLRVEIAYRAKSFRPRGWKFSTYVLNPASMSTADWCRLQRNRGVYVPKWSLGATGVRVADHELQGNLRYERTRPDLPDAPIMDETFWEKAAGVATLTPRERDIIVAHYRNGESYESIRHRYGVTKTAIGLSAQRALKKIRASGAMDDYDAA